MKGSNKAKFNLLRPLQSHKYDRHGFPIIKKEIFTDEDISHLNLTNLSNVNRDLGKQHSLVTMFNYDILLDRLWSNIDKYVPVLSNYFAVATPDYSTYQDMNDNVIRYNTYRNRWVGAYLQEQGIKVIPTIGWGSKETFKYAFLGVEKGSVVIVSTIVCQKVKKDFLMGYNKMMKIIKPSLVIVYGKLIPGMKGKIVNFAYEDAFLGHDASKHIKSMQKEVK